MLDQQYGNRHHNVVWKGYDINDNDKYRTFMATNVRNRLNDTDGQEIIEIHLRSLASTGFEVDNLETLLNAKSREERYWAVGESFSEAILEEELDVVFPWNHTRDLRNENASLPGADIVGLINDNGQYKLLFGEVKTSEENRYPPQVVTARHGIANQLETLGTDQTRIITLISWLLYRCKDTEYETGFSEAIKYLLSTNSNQGLYLVGVLVRPNITANVNDLQSRGISLGDIFDGTVTKALLLAFYLPQALNDFANLAIGDNR